MEHGGVTKRSGKLMKVFTTFIYFKSINITLSLYSLYSSVLVGFSAPNVTQAHILHIQFPQHRRHKDLMSSGHFVIGVYVMCAERRYRHSRPRAARLPLD